jgi:hypothetical protein
MPHKVWTHFCPVDAENVRVATEECSLCGKRGAFDGWGYSMVERMGAYQRRTGLKPMGSHRPLADRLLAHLFRDCPVCAGRDLLDNGDEQSWHFCIECDGTGRIIADRAEFEQARMEVLRVFPDAAVPGNLKRTS